MFHISAPLHYDHDTKHLLTNQLLIPFFEATKFLNIIHSF